VIADSYPPEHGDRTVGRRHAAPPGRAARRGIAAGGPVHTRWCIARKGPRKVGLHRFTATSLASSRYRRDSANGIGANQRCSLAWDGIEPGTSRYRGRCRTTDCQVPCLNHHATLSGEAQPVSSRGPESSHYSVASGSCPVWWSSQPQHLRGGAHSRMNSEGTSMALVGALPKPGCGSWVSSPRPWIPPIPHPSAAPQGGRLRFRPGSRVESWWVAASARQTNARKGLRA
jgi:hypothetical protein